MGKNIGYQLRSPNGEVVVAGSFGGQLDMETAERLVNAFLTVTILPSGTPVFFDKKGRQVRLLINVNPRETSIGKKALSEYWANLRKCEEAASEERRALQDQLDGLTNDELRDLLAMRSQLP